MEILTLIGTIVSTVGLTLGIVKLVMKIQENKPSVKARLSWGMLTYPMNQLSDTMLLLEAANTGQRPVTISSTVIRLPDSRQLVWFDRHSSNVEFPHELLPGKSCTVWAPVKEAAQSLKQEGYSKKVKLRAVFSDQTGGKYVSKPFRLNVEEWAKQK